MAVPAYKNEYYQPETELSGAPGAAGAEQRQRIKFYRYPWVFSEIPGLGFAAGLAYNVLEFKAGDHGFVRMGSRVLAKCMGISRKMARGLLRKLEQKGWIEPVRGRRWAGYNITYIMGRSKSLPIFADQLERRQFNLSKLAVLHYIWWRQGTNGWCWQKQEDIARDLALSVRTVRQDISWLRANGLIQVRARGNNHNKGNKYAVTVGAGLPVRDHGPGFSEANRAARQETTEERRAFDQKRHRLKRRPLDKDPLLGVILKPSAEISPLVLSSAGPKASPGPQQVYLRLVNIGVAAKTARSIAFVQLHPPESVAQAIRNGRLLQARQRQEAQRLGLRPRLFNLAGYVIRALNGARSEGKIVGATKLFREAAALSCAMKSAKAKAVDWQPPSVAECDRRRRAMKRALGLPA